MLKTLVNVEQKTLPNARKRIFTVSALLVCAGIIAAGASNQIPSAQNYFLIAQYAATLSIIGITIRYYRIPSEKVGKTFAYFFTIFPLAIASVSLILLYVIEAIGGKVEQPLKADLGFVILSSIAAIFVMVITDKKIDNLQLAYTAEITKLEKNLNEKINNLESRLDVINNNQDVKTNIHESIIDILSQLELLKSELERSKKSDLKLNFKKNRQGKKKEH